MIQFEKVTKTFPLGNKALQEVTFEIEKGEFVFLVGPSGAGKTTILKLILKDYKANSGSIVIDDIDITAKQFKNTQKLRQKIGVIFQDFKILDDKNIFENVALSLKVVGASEARIKTEVNQALALVGIPSKGALFPSQLSAGELQRVAIARAMVGDRTILLADEPTGNLDPKTAWEIMKIFKKLEKEKTIIFATHNTDIVNSLRRRVLVMKDGQLVKDNRKGGYEL